MKIQVSGTVEIGIQDLARAFVEAGSDEQANFLDTIGQAFKQANFSAEYQCCWIADALQKDGRDFIFTLANYAKVKGLRAGCPKENTLINSYLADPLDPLAAYFKPKEESVTVFCSTCGREYLKGAMCPDCYGG